MLSTVSDVIRGEAKASGLKHRSAVKDLRKRKISRERLQRLRTSVPPDMFGVTRGIRSTTCSSLSSLSSATRASFSDVLRGNVVLKLVSEAVRR